MKKNARDLINQFAAEEAKFCGARFLAPAIAGGTIKVRLGDVICKIKIGPSDFSGFGVFETISFNEAILVEEASMIQRQKYLKLFPVVRLIAARRVGNRWYGAASSRGDTRFQIKGLVPIQLVENVSHFDVIDCRFDGEMFWFDRATARANPRHADGLRKALLDEVPPVDVAISGLSAEHRAAYELSIVDLIKSREPVQDDSYIEMNRYPESDPKQLGRANGNGDPNLSRIRESLSHAGARLLGYTQQHGNYQVTYEVAGRQFSSAVDQENLGLVSAGICLDGYDREFDLTSLVGVLREGMNSSQL